MALSGTLETFSLPDVLRLLATTKKTGLLALDGDRGSGWLWVEDGDLATASADRSVVDDLDAVLFELLRFADASFEFDATAPAPQPGAGDRREVEGALEVANRRLDEWREIETVIPSLDVRVRMVTEIEGDISVTADAWRVLACLGAGASGHDVARQLGQGEYEVCSALRDLVERHLIDVEVDVEVDVTDEHDQDEEPDAVVAEDAAPVVADAFAAMVSAPDVEPVPVYEVPEAPVFHLAADDGVADGEDEIDAEVEGPAADRVDMDSDVDADAPAGEPDDGEDVPAAREGSGDLDQNLLLRFLSSTKP